MSNTIVKQHLENFETLTRAFAHKHACLMDCVEKATGEHVAVICAAWKDEEGMINITPFAKFFNGNPFDMLISPDDPDYAKYPG